MRRRLGSLAAVVAVVASGALLAGCGIHDPYNTGSTHAALLPPDVLPSSHGTTAATIAAPAAVTNAVPPSGQAEARRDDDPSPGSGSPGPRPSVGVGRPGTAAGVAGRYALVYAGASGADPCARVRRLAALAAPALARRLGASAPGARGGPCREQGTTPGLPSGGRETAKLLAVALSPAGAGRERGVAVVRQTLQATDPRHSATSDQATFQVAVTRVAGRWRVDRFEAAP